MRTPRIGSYPLNHYGLIASGNSLMRNVRMRDRLGDRHNVLCFEMEAAGVVNSIPCWLFEASVTTVTRIKISCGRNMLPQLLPTQSCFFP